MEDNKGNLSHYQMAAVHQKQKKIKDAKYKEKSKKRLSNIITTKMKTSFIGAISACESSFGFLWGHGISDDKLTDEQRAMRDIWEEARAQILDNGNSQLRASINEINNYDINWNRYQIDFKIEEQE